MNVYVNDDDHIFQLKLSYHSDKQIFLTPAGRRWSIVVFFGSSVSTELSLLNIFGSIDGLSVREREIEQQGENPQL
jgi:hypothetical protein